MATQEEALSYVRRKFVTRELSESAVTLTMELKDERSQLMIIRVDENWIHFESGFAKIGTVDPLEAAQLANEYILGIQATDEVFLVRHVIPLENLDESEVNDGIMLVSSIGDELEKKLTGEDLF